MSGSFIFLLFVYVVSYALIIKYIMCVWISVEEVKFGWT